MEGIEVKMSKPRLTAPFLLWARQIASFILSRVAMHMWPIAKVRVIERSDLSIQRLIALFFLFRLHIDYRTVWPNRRLHPHNLWWRNARWVVVRFSSRMGEHLWVNVSSTSCCATRATEEGLYQSNGRNHSVSDCGLVPEDTSTKIQRRTEFLLW